MNNHDTSSSQTMKSLGLNFNHKLSDLLLFTFLKIALFNFKNENYVGSEFLPEGWNSQEAIYALRYVDPTSNRTYLMKALAIEGSLILHLLVCHLCFRFFVNVYK